MNVMSIGISSNPALKDLITATVVLKRITTAAQFLPILQITRKW
jgi:hypothetical protein